MGLGLGVGVRARLEVAALPTAMSGATARICAMTAGSRDICEVGGVKGEG